MKRLPVAAFFIFLTANCFGQYQTTPAALRWADSVFNTLSNEERIAQLMVLRGSSISAKGVVYYDKEVNEAITKYNVGGVCLFQGPPVKQANIVNHYQRIAKTPVLICIDAEWGLGMRMDSVIPLNHQLMLGAVQDGSIVYKYGQLVGEQCRRAGIQVNYAPVVDINNNPDNPVINDRSFGEDKYKVALYGIQYMKGMQDVGTMATAKHFPGHGDVAVDSHLDLPVINKTRAQLDSLELYPFREIFKAGVGSVMVAHLYIPAIDNAPNRATSISRNNVTELLRNELGYQGLTFTDALNMQGVAKFFPGGEIAVQSVIAGNDMLCLPADVPGSIDKIKEAISKKLLNWDDIYRKCKKVLAAKYMYGLGNIRPVDTDHLTEDLNSGVNAMKRLVAENAITLLSKTDDAFFPLMPAPPKQFAAKEVAYVGVGLSNDNAFARRMRSDYNADVFYFNYKQDAGRILSMVSLIKRRYKTVIIGVHAYNRYPANNFGISPTAIDLTRQLQQQTRSITFVFGNPYAIKNFCDAGNLLACYEDDSITQHTAADILMGRLTAKGKMPVTVCPNIPYGSGIVLSDNRLPVIDPRLAGFDPEKLKVIDSIALDAIANGATPGAVVMALKDGKIVFQKAFGTLDYGGTEPMTLQSIFDMASITKICATTISVMRLYDEGKIDITKRLGDYLPWVRGSDKENLVLEKILLHQAGLVAWIPFFRETIDSASKAPLASIYSKYPDGMYNVRVAENLYMRSDWKDTMYKRMLDSKLGAPDKYIYSDNDFIFLGKVVEAVSGLPLEKYVKQNFYDPLGLMATGFKPRERFTLDRIVPTETEKLFRLQHIRGDVHDPGAAMFGGVAGHAGLFSTAYDLAVIMQMLLNGGSFNGRQYIKPETVKLFTAYNSAISHRGFGFDKPYKGNDTLQNPYPARLVSPLTFGHTGFTGTCVWADPKYNIVYVFLSNRVNPDGGDNLKLSRLNVRGKIQDQVYKAMGL